MTPAKPVALWLFACCVLVFSMIVLGGVTRLTHSGLSMVDWDPVMGIVPPLSQEDWNRAFEQYKQFPEYQQINFEMDLSGFKRIFYFEYAHRVLGRIIGLTFLLPFLFFLIRGYIGRRQVPRFLLMFLLGGMQGLLGWYMVQSGLVDRPSVSQYRLTAHLLLAVFIYCYMLWVALEFWRRPLTEPSPARPLLGFAWLTLALVLLMIASGGFVAGTRAGFVFNTFPMMGNEWIPPGVLGLEPVWRNFFDNVVTIQLTHRVLALVVAVSVVVLAFRTARSKEGGGAMAGLLLLAVFAQLGLGIATLLYRVPTTLAASHQGGAVVLITAVLITAHWLKYDPRDGRQQS